MVGIARSVSIEDLNKLVPDYSKSQDEAARLHEIVKDFELSFFTCRDFQRYLEVKSHGIYTTYDREFLEYLIIKVKQRMDDGK